VQYYTIATLGLRAYIKEYFDPIFIMLPLNIVGKFASIISMAFRLYGNIFGGSTIATIYFSILHGSTLFQTIGLLSGINLIVLLFFGLFEGAIQAFVFAMLTITYLSIAVSSEQSEKPIGKS
jgi:F-type H+-transporting ATPase subunit a